MRAGVCSSVMVKPARKLLDTVLTNQGRFLSAKKENTHIIIQ